METGQDRAIQESLDNEGHEWGGETQDKRSNKRSKGKKWELNRGRGKKVILEGKRREAQEVVSDKKKIEEVNNIWKNIK